VPQPRAKVSTRGGFAWAYVDKKHPSHALKQAIREAFTGEKLEGPIAARVIENDRKESEKLRDGSKQLREENEHLKSRLVSCEVRAFASGFVCCGLFFGFVLVSVIVYLLIAG
jgi:hypothetical protein